MDFQPPALGENEFLFKPLSLGYFVMAARGDWDNLHTLRTHSPFSNPPTLSSHLLHSSESALGPTVKGIFPKGKPDPPPLWNTSFVVQLDLQAFFIITNKATVHSFVHESFHTCNTIYFCPLMSPAWHLHVTEYALGTSECHHSPPFPSCHSISFPSWLSSPPSSHASLNWHCQHLSVLHLRSMKLIMCTYDLKPRSKHVDNW